jgi:hypothetical protein
VIATILFGCCLFSGYFLSLGLLVLLCGDWCFCLLCCCHSQNPVLVLAACRGQFNIYKNLLGAEKVNVIAHSTFKNFEL